MNDNSKELLKMFENRNKTSFEFDIKYEDFLKYINRKIELINYENLNIWVKKPNLVSKSFEFIFLIHRSIDYFISAISLLRQRAYFETGSILRMSIETASTAYHIKESKIGFKNFKQNNYSSSKSITFAKKRIPIFGEFWGELSNIFVHINKLHGIKENVIKKNNYKHIIQYGNFDFGIRNEEEEIEDCMIILSKISINLIYRFFELIFYKDVLIYKTIKGKYQPDIKTFKVGAMVETEIENLVNELKLC